MIRSLWILLGWALILLVLYLSLFTSYIPKQTLSNVDKLHHFIAYGTLMFWFSQSFKGQSRLWIAGALVAMGIAIEFAQPFTGRQFSYLDMLANTGGVLLGLLVATKGGDFLYQNLQKKDDH